jgi:two-component system chemotaxis sensor kinase CheA
MGNAMDEELIQEFLAESWENLGCLDTEIVELEKNPGNRDLLASVFRTIHTIKGTCGFIGLNQLGAVAHSTENVLGRMREGELDVTEDAISMVLSGVDRIKELLDAIEATGSEPDVDNSALIGKLDALAVAASGEASATTEETVHRDGSRAASEAPDQSETEERDEAQCATRAAAETDESLPSTDEPLKPGEPGRKSVADLSIRVNVDVLDSLMNLVGELVLARNQLLQLARGDEESKYAGPIAHLNRITTDLQDGVMKTRMQPIGNAWGKLPRLVRDLSQITGKQIQLEMSGEDTELDRTVLDAIKDPLTHMVRNSADHGIEDAQRRRERGKPEMGKIRLNAYHEGGHVIISIEDDGAGIDMEKLREKAFRTGLLSEQDASEASDHEILNLVFAPGFSTAESVSSVSGRGVGMDVVRSQIEKIGGTVDLTSRPGQGTAVRIKIPLTLAIISALVVESGGDSFAIPQLGVVELVRLSAEERGRVESIHDRQVLRLRDRLLPLVYLNAVLGMDEADGDEAQQDLNIVVVQAGDEEIGLIVSQVFDTEEIVVKPVGSLLRDIEVYQGTTILGDGRVIMILDIAGIASHLADGKPARSEIDSHTESSSVDSSERTSLLLFDAGGETTMAVPLSLVSRLEEIPRSQIEKTGNGLVVQYRGDLLPLVPVADSGGHELQDPQPVIVFSEGSNSMGLMVSRILDVREEQLVIRMHSQRPGVLGTAIVNGNATEIIDTQHYVLAVNPAWFLHNEQRAKARVLVVDDSPFLRQLALTTLEADGYVAVGAESVHQATDLVERARPFDAIVSDLEMPETDGWEFAAWLRQRSETAQTPLIALTAYAGAEHENRALDAGFDRFLVKFDAQVLCRTLEELVAKPKAETGVMQ